MKRLASLFLFVTMVALATAQVTSNPSPIPVGYTGQIVLTFDPTLGTGGMKNATECYSHIGLITASSKNISDWKYIQTPTGWGTTKEPQWTKSGSKWTLTIDNMYTFFGCPMSDTIKYIVMVFHNGKGGTKDILEGKSSTTSNGDILVGIGTEAKADIWEGFTPKPCETAKRPTDVVNGIYYGKDGTSVTLCTYAASKTQPANHVYLLSDLSDWQLKDEYQMKRDGNYFWITLTGLTKGKQYRYQYAIERADGVKKQISDLFSELLLTPDDGGEPSKVYPNLPDYPITGAQGYVSVMQPSKTAFTWSTATTGFKRPNKNNLVIYELWIYDHTPIRCIEGLMERLDYLQNLGVNCIELMPVNEFDGNYSWGYCPNHYFALDKAYGSSDQLKTFIDECHKRGMAVILDMVFNHATGNNPMNKLYPYTSSTPSKSDLSQNPWFNVTAPHADNVFEDWNHGFEPTKDHFTRVLKYWLTEYKVDGYRMDLSHGLCSDKAGTSVENLKYYYNNGVKAVAQDAYFILEHWGDKMGSERPQLVNEGMMCWENTCNAYEQVTMGWLKDGDDLNNSNSDNYVSYSENHDEERCFFKAKQWGNGPSSGPNMKNDLTTRAARIPLVLGFQSMLNGPQLFYHYAELGFDNSKFQDENGKWGTDGIAAYGKGISTDTVGWEVKMSKKIRPEGLGWFEAGSRMSGYQRLAQIIQLRTRLLPSVFEGNPTASSVGAGKALRTIQWGSNVYVVGNFSATDVLTAYLPSGTWYDYLDGGSAAAASYQLQPGTIKVFTGSKIDAPQVPDHYNFSVDVENVYEEWSQSASQASKFCHEGQIYILREGIVYDLFGRRVN